MIFETIARHRIHWWSRFTFALFLVTAMHTAIAASPIEVNSLDCATGVHLVAQNAPISEIVERLARAKGFRVTADERVSTVVTIDSVRPTQRLLAEVLKEENTIVQEEADPECPGRFRVTRVWILARRSMAAGVPQPPPRKPAYVTPEAKEQDNIYRRAHGLPPE